MIKANAPCEENGEPPRARTVVIFGLLGISLVINTFISARFLMAEQAVLPAKMLWATTASQDATPLDTTNYIPPVEEVARSHVQDGIECPYPLIPIYDKIVNQGESNQTIPKAFHFAWLKGYKAQNGQGRCISPDMMEVPQAWMEHFPSYNVYFHDDISVEALFDQEWPEFPALAKFMKYCVKYGNAMKIDIWRQMILYRYGGIYVDLDMLPGPELTENSIQPEDAAMFLSDPWHRPSQWFMAMEKKSPIAYFTLYEIMKRLYEQGDVAQAKLVFLTGPDALKFGYMHAVRGEDYSTIYKIGLHNSTMTKGPFRKLEMGNIRRLDQGDPVPYPRNHTSTSDYVNVTKKDRMHKEMKGIHWKQMKPSTVHGRCQDILYQNDFNATEDLK